MKTPNKANAPVKSATLGQLQAVADELGIATSPLDTKAVLYGRIEAARKQERMQNNITIRESAMAMAKRREALKDKWAKYEALKAMWPDMPGITVEQKRTGLYPMTIENFEMRLEGFDWASIALLALADSLGLPKLVVRCDTLLKRLERREQMGRLPMGSGASQNYLLGERNRWDDMQDAFTKANPYKGRRRPTQSALKDERRSANRASNSADARFMRDREENAVARPVAIKAAPVADLVSPVVSNPGRW